MIGFETQHDQNTFEYTPLLFVPLSFSNNPGLVPTKLSALLWIAQYMRGRKRQSRDFK